MIRNRSGSNLGRNFQDFIRPVYNGGRGSMPSRKSQVISSEKSKRQNFINVYFKEVNVLALNVKKVNILP